MTVGQEHSVDIVHGKGLRIEVITNPFADFFVPIIFSVSESLDKFVVSGDASAVVRLARGFPVDADWIPEIGIKRIGK